MFEMLTGFPPFYSQDRKELFERIKYGSVRYPANMSNTVKNLLDGIFIKDPAMRFDFGNKIKKNKLRTIIFFQE